MKKRIYEVTNGITSLKVKAYCREEAYFTAAKRLGFDGTKNIFNDKCEMNGFEVYLVG